MMGGFNLQTCARPNILALQPYRCARDDYEDNGVNILLDANENAFGPGLSIPPKTNGTSKTSNGTANNSSTPALDLDFTTLNRYPDPHQVQLKSLLCNLRNPVSDPVLKPENVYIGVGSDETIDSLIRTFCTPGKDSLLICPPTYGMYNVSAAINDVSLVKVPLNPDFSVDVPSILKTLDEDKSIKLMYITSPGNPTGKAIPQQDIEAILSHPTWNGVLVVDEAYIDFTSRSPSLTSLSRTNSPWDPPSLAPLVTKHPNLVVMGTLSKGHGLAGLRLGFVFADKPVAAILNALKAPYNISVPTAEIALQALSPASLEIARANIDRVIVQRERLIRLLPQVPGVGKIIGGLDANFLLVQILEGSGGQPSNPVALTVYERLAGSKGVVVRFRGKEHGCEGCLRVTVGTEKEVDVFLREIKVVLDEVLSGTNGAVTGNGRNTVEEDRKEAEESAVVA